MNDLSNILERYPIEVEVSGWDSDREFFVENANQSWTQSGTQDGQDESRKELVLHRSLSEGAIVFIRRFSLQSSSNSISLPYRVESVQPMDSDGRCEIGILRLHPRSKAPVASQLASNLGEGVVSNRKTGESTAQLELEEIFHEA
jgi:hypothetical protein